MTDDFKQFLATVARMRLAQNTYFRNRANGNLRQAQADEAEVDRLLKLHGHGLPAVADALATQTRLFG